MKKIFVLSLLLSSVILAWCGVKSATQKPTNTVTQSATSNIAAEKYYTLAEVQSHNSQFDCRIIINSKVYDITAYFSNHPWGDNTLTPLCWMDWTNEFNKYHQGGGKAKSVLESFQIWILE